MHLPRVRVAIISVALFLSGFSALLFQTLWLRLSGLAFGNSIWSAALILSSFMAGLALGSAIAAMLSLEGLRPLRVYAGLETIVAAFGCTLVFALPHLGQWLRPLFQMLWSDQGLLNLLRFILSFLILLIPTTAMGITLPVLLEDPLLQRSEFQKSIGAFYGCNTLGAVAGALSGELILVKALGLFGTALAAACISCGAAAIAFSFAGQAIVTPKTLTNRRLRISFGPRIPWSLLVANAGAGAILLALEVIWFRFLRLYVASKPIAFCVMLAVVLSGIGLGGVAASVNSIRVSSRRTFLAFLLTAAGLATLICYLYFPIPASDPEIKRFYVEDVLKIGALSAALMFPVSFVSGMIFPTLLAAVQRELPNRMNSAGLAILCNTIGASLGPLLAAFVLLPSVGFQASLIIAAAGYVSLAILVNEKWTLLLHQPSGKVLLGLMAIFAAIVVFFPFHRDEMHFANARRPYELDGSRLVRKIEGNADTFQLLRRDLFGQPYYYRLITNGYSMSATQPRTQSYMRLFAYLPLAIRPESEQALLICYGVGVTADAFTRDARLKHLDVVDTSKEVFGLSDLYSGPVYSNPLRDPRVTTFVQDGRFFLQVAPQQYDIITGEPPPLKIAGTVNLYTQQFFSLINARLKDGGIATFWLPVYQLTPNEAKSILRAFHNVFPQTSVWATSDLEWIMMGIKPPLPFADSSRSDSIWNNPKIQSDLLRIGIEVPEQMSALFLMDGDEIDQITHDVAPLDDLYPKRLSDVHSDLDTAYRFAAEYFDRNRALQRFRSSNLIQAVWPNEWKGSLEPFFLVREMRYVSQLTGSNWLEELDIYLRHTRLRNPVLAVQDSDEFRLMLAERLDGTTPPSEVLPDLITGALAKRDFARAIQLLEIERDRRVARPNDVLLLVYLYCLNDNVDKAEALAQAEAGSIPTNSVTEWLWGNLQAEFGFRPPR